MGFRGEIYSRRYTTQYGQRTYFFNLKENRLHDLFLSVVESVKTDSTFQRFNRSQIIVFKSDWPEFVDHLLKIKNDLSGNDKTFNLILQSSNSSRLYHFTSVRQQRIHNISISEHKPDSENNRSLLINLLDFPMFIQHFSEIIAISRNAIHAKI